MKPRNTIFDSPSEADLFESLHGRWEPHFRLFPHVPFANLVELDQHRLSAEEFSFLHKTSVDFVLTATNWKPVLAVEFDGLGHGFSQGGTYIQTVPSPKDHHRQWKLGLKVRVATDAKLPIVIVSYDEKATFDPETGLTIAHGIIGQFLANLHVDDKVRQLYEDARSEINAMTGEEQAEYIQDYVIIPAEHESNLAWNPIAARQSQLMARAFDLAPISRWGHDVFEDPKRPPEADLASPNFDVDSLKSWWKSVRRWGSSCWVDTAKGRATSGTVWVRNLDVPGVSPISLAADVAELLAWRQAVRLLSPEPTHS